MAQVFLRHPIHVYVYVGYMYIYILQKTLATAVTSSCRYVFSCTLTTRHRASTSMYSLTFRVRVTTPRSMDEMERRTQQARRC